MKERMSFLIAVTFTVTFSSLLGVAQFPVQASEPPPMLAEELLEPGAALGDTECDPPAEAPRLELQPPKATPVSSGSFYVCFDGGGFLCGECPSGTHCATEACGSPSAPHCTFAFACVSSCSIVNCSFLAPDCRDL